MDSVPDAIESSEAFRSTEAFRSFDSPVAPVVVAVARDDAHRFSKPLRDAIVLIAGHGVEGDAHAGPKMRHRSRVKRVDIPPNLRQVHLIQRELFDELAALGHEIAPGELGENVTTVGIDLLSLPRGTRIRLGDSAEVELTGLRNPCVQIDRFQSGLMKRLIRRAILASMWAAGSKSRTSACKPTMSSAGT